LLTRPPSVSLKKQLAGEEEIKLFIWDFLLEMEAVNADFDDIRGGSIFATQCDGMGCVHAQSSALLRVRLCSLRVLLALLTTGDAFGAQLATRLDSTLDSQLAEHQHGA
jgi:hypothetical protein